MLLPKLSICTINNCTTLKITENTGIYTIGTNYSGWNSPNIPTSSVITATITITSPSNTETIINVLSQLPVTYTANFNFSNIDITPEDGEWKIKYTLTTSTDTYSNSYAVFLSCSVRCCIDKLWIKVLTSKSEENPCDCDCDEMSMLMKKVMLMESLYTAMINSVACNNSDARNKILKQLQRLCKIEKCNC